jgi:pyruvate,water dikinase
MKYVRLRGHQHEDVPLVGGKNASLGEMYRHLASQGVTVPNGFAITAEAYRYVLERAGLLEALHAALDGLHAEDLQDLAARAARAREIVYSAQLPADLPEELLEGYRRLRQDYG